MGYRCPICNTDFGTDKTNFEEHTKECSDESLKHKNDIKKICNLIKSAQSNFRKSEQQRRNAKDLIENYLPDDTISLCHINTECNRYDNLEDTIDAYINFEDYDIDILMKEIEKIIKC